MGIQYLSKLLTRSSGQLLCTRIFSSRWIDSLRSLHVVETATNKLEPNKQQQPGDDSLFWTTKSNKIVLYRGRWMRTFRLVVRLKVLQLGAVAGLVIPLAEYSEQGSLSSGAMLASFSVIGGAGGAAIALWYYSCRYIGELSLLPPYPNNVQISVLDFWGNREDLQVDLRDIIPPLKGLTRADLERLADQPIIPLDVKGVRQFFLSLRYGHLIKKDALMCLLYGTLKHEDSVCSGSE